MSSFFLFTLSAHFVGNSYVFLRLYRAFERNSQFLATLPWFLCMGLWPLTLRLASGYQRIQDALYWAGNIWLPFGVSVLLLFLFVDGLGVCIWMVNRFRAVPLRTPFRTARTAWAILLLSLLLCGYGLYEAHTIRAVHVVLPTAKLPEGKTRLRLVFFSDVHLGAWIGPKMLRRVTDCIATQQPDIILMGGDLLDGSSLKGRTEDLDLLRGLEAPHGKFAVMGNHEAYFGIAESVRFFEQAGLTLLRRQAVEAGGITIVGVDDPRISTAEGSNNDDPLPLLERADQSRFILLLDHRPWLREKSVGLFDLQLSGHSHGGQIWPGKWLVHWLYGTPNGLSFHCGPQGSSAVFVTTGTGFARMPMRFLVPPEVVVVDLVREGR